jgi:hypothetical protein
MRAPHFVRLAQIDEQHFISACRHGLVHLTWGRATLRLLRNEFRNLADLLEQVTEAQAPNSARHGQIEVSARIDGDGELRLGTLVLLLSPDEFQRFAQTAREAVTRLDRFLASGVWDRDEEDSAPSGFSPPFQRTPFSEN